MLKRTWMVFLAVGLTAVVLSAGTAVAQPKDMGGWEKDGVYNGFYKVSEADSLKATINSLEEASPLPGMSPGLILEVEDRDGEKIMVHVGPLWFVGDAPMRKGDEVKIKGVWAEIEGREVFLMSKVKKEGAYEYKVRLTKDGTPFWTMTEDEVARERAAE